MGFLSWRFAMKDEPDVVGRSGHRLNRMNVLEGRRANYARQPERVRAQRVNVQTTVLS
jgi:hypothetical protein